MNPNPPYIHPPYKSSILRGPKMAPVKTETILIGPQPDPQWVGSPDADLTRNGAKSGEPNGERIIVAGRLLEQNGRPIAHSIVEIWQANAAGRYIHKNDQHDAPVDENFFGAGRCVTDGNGNYSFSTIKPGAYPWGNHYNAWRPPHIHFSVFGSGFGSRLITQMYFPGDPLLALDPIFNALPDEEIKQRLVSKFSLKRTVPDIALGYEFDIVLRGNNATPLED